jgi:hypothetical protein
MTKLMKYNGHGYTSYPSTQCSHCEGSGKVVQLSKNEKRESVRNWTDGKSRNEITYLSLLQTCHDHLSLMKDEASVDLTQEVYEYLVQMKVE